MKRPEDYKDARFYGIPCWYNLTTADVIPKNKLCDMLINIAIWIDVNIFQTEEFKIKVKWDKPQIGDEE